MVRKNTCPTCGGEKDGRAVECMSCSSYRKATRQWKDKSVRKRMQDGMNAKAKTRRKLFEHITLDSNWSRRTDGRAYTYYWEGDTKRFIYRYQWVWMQVNGAIPKGYAVHHKNHDRTDDRLENLEIMPRDEHAHLHEPERRNLAIRARGLEPISEAERLRTCEVCGKQFAIKVRAKSNRFCSLPCYWESMRDK